MTNDTNEINVFADGGARGNPGPSAIGVHIEDSEGNHVASLGKKIGHGTNNMAEYTAVVEAFDLILEMDIKPSKVNFYLDSNLVVSQLNGVFKIKNANLRELLFKIKEKESLVGCPTTYSHIPREKNIKADELVNKALDNLL
ncbi:MAG: hypothetical protein A2596_01625 [Candidatus Levybacteria bacterium RIFOXYD1_FULL_40_21]|nr:MAG: hypothetical protein A2596_01625 [Candidatus Levybacteria bacterium RIFOXYD1_FULL_40_21]